MENNEPEAISSGKLSSGKSPQDGSVEGLKAGPSPDVGSSLVKTSTIVNKLIQNVVGGKGEGEVKMDVVGEEKYNRGNQNVTKVEDKDTKGVMDASRKEKDTIREEKDTKSVEKNASREEKDTKKLEKDVTGKKYNKGKEKDVTRAKEKAIRVEKDTIRTEKDAAGDKGNAKGEKGTVRPEEEDLETEKDINGEDTNNKGGDKYVKLEENSKRGKEQSADAKCSPVETSSTSKSSPVKTASTSKSSPVKTASNSSSNEPQRHMFHLSDQTKRGLSLLTYPSKTPSRKKGMVASRSTPNSRITIGEALEKAQDARKSISNISSNIPEPIQGSALSHSTSDQLACGLTGNRGEGQPQPMLETAMAREEVGDSGGTLLEKENVIESLTLGSTPGPPQSTPTRGSINSHSGETASLEGKSLLPPAVKNRPPGTSRLKMTTRMGELLKFTFTHEHFPSSVHMARLAKMMGVQWSQIRNWFTDHRVANKRAGLFPRDKVLSFCPYCKVLLRTESEQKLHLFSTLHVKTLLGPEYVGPTPTSESITWKQLPKTVNAVSKNSGAKILAIGYSEDKYGSSNKGKKTEQLPTKQKTADKMDGMSEENATHSEKLQKRWENSVLLKGKMENSTERMPIKQVQGKFGGFNGHRQPELIEMSCNPSKTEEKSTMILPNSDQASPLVATDEFPINSHVKLSQSKTPPAGTPCHTPEPHPGDPCTSKITLDTAEVTRPPSEDPKVLHKICKGPVEDNNILYKISRRGHIIPSITVRSGGKVPKRPISLLQKPKVCSVSVADVSSSVTLGDGKVTMPLKEILTGRGKVEGRKENMGISTKICIDSTDDDSVSQEIVYNEVSNSSSRATSWSDTMENQDIIKIENPMFQAINHSSTARQKWSPYITTHPMKNPRPPSVSSPIAKLYTAKERYKPHETTAVNKVLPHNPSIVSRIPADELSSVTRTPGPSGEKQPQPQLHHGSSLYLRTSRTSLVEDEGMLLGYQCPTCSKIFQTEWLMIKHSITHLKYQCCICNQVFPTECILKHHLLDHLSWAYEDEKYYCQFACKTCHSLKCECYEPTYCKPRKLPRRYIKPQKAIRTKKNFITKFNSGSNDHLRVTLSDYKKILKKSPYPENVNKSKSIPISQKAPVTLANITHPTVQKLQTQIKPVEVPPECNMVDSKLEILNPNKETELRPNDKDQSNSKPIEGTTEHNSMTDASVSLNIPASYEPSVDEEPAENSSLVKRNTSKRKPTKLSNNYIYKDADFYYMCETCDASFLSKAELSEHMFFHRLKSRSRRGEKRGNQGIFEEENEVSKKTKFEELQNKAEFETIRVGGFQRYKCPLCKGHFASITDLNRHRTQAHKIPAIELTPSVDVVPTLGEVFQCVYCEKVYRRDRELRRHFKHDCSLVPQSLKDSLSPGVGISFLQKDENGPHYRKVKRNVGEHFLNEPGTSKSPVKTGQRGPITCKYCLIETRREAEMKRHVWKYCPRIPKEIVRQFKAGVTLEKLGFHYGTKNDNLHETDKSKNPSTSSLHMETESPATTTISSQVPQTFPLPSPPSSGVVPASPQPHTVPVLDGQVAYRSTSSPVQSSQNHVSLSPNASPVKSLPIPGQVIPVPLPMITGSKSRHPLVCGYCGIWYFREQAILKHMKERCIRLPPYEKELLANGVLLCNVPQERSVSVSLAPGSIATYKMVQVPEQIVTDIPVKTVDSVSNEDMKILSSEVFKSIESKPVESPIKIEQQISLASSLQTPLEAVVIKNTPSRTLGRPKKRPGRKPLRPGISKGTRCRRCHEHFDSAEAVLAHSSVHHGPKKGLYKCKLCFIKLPKYKQLREHIWEHTNETPYRCHVCLIKFRSSEFLLEHLHSSHDYNIANERNLFRWLPDRNGKYREIKAQDKNCEESLGDMDANLDSLAEIMVITDSDICSLVKEKSDKDSARSNLPKDGGKTNNNPVIKLAANEKTTTGAKEQSVPRTDKGANKSKEKVEKDISLQNENNNEGCERKNEGKSLFKDDEEGNYGDISGTTDTLELNLSKSGTSNSSLFDSSFIENGEILNNMDNLDSVIETIHLTDKHLS